MNQKKSNKLAIILFLLISIGVLYLKSLLYDSFVLQNIYLGDINNYTWQKDSTFINEINDNFPTLTNTTIPIKSIKGKYIYENLDPSKGIEYMKRGIKDNPYLMYSEANIADAYIGIEPDSFNIYARRAFKNLPNNPANFVMFSNIMKNENKIDSILYYFDIISKRVNDEQLYRVALASIIGEKDSTIVSKAINIANEAIDRFPNRKELFAVYSDKITYGQDNYNLAIEINEAGVAAANDNDLRSALALFSAAFSNQPNNPIYFTNVIRSFYELQEFQMLINFYDKNSEKIDKIALTTSYHYYESLINLLQYEKACKLISKIDPEMRLDITKDLISKC